MGMSSGENKVQRTQHAFLVTWGWFAEHIDAPERFEQVTLKQKRYHHTPQSKVLEFLVSILGGAQYLQDTSQAAHPLDKDQAVAEAWGQHFNSRSRSTRNGSVKNAPPAIWRKQATWMRVGANAELAAWHNLQLTKCPYPLDVALERFYTGKTLRYSALFHFGADPVTEDLPGWFKCKKPRAFL